MSVKKRRPDSRKRKKRNSPSLARKPEDYKWGPEALSIVFGAISVFLLCSIVVQHAELRVMFGIEDRSDKILGPVGRFVGVMLYGSMGWGSLTLVAWTAFLSVQAWKEQLLLKDIKHPVWVLSLGSVGVLFSLCTVLAILFGESAGGSIGIMASKPLLMLFSVVGALIVTTALFVLSLSFALGMSVIQMTRLAWDLITDLVALVFITIPLMLFGWITFLLSKMLGGIVLVLEAIFSEEIIGKVGAIFSFFRRQENDDRPMPKPQIRKNVIEDDSDKDLDFEDDDEVEYEIQVRRRGGDEKVSVRDLQAIRRRLKESAPAADIYYSGKYDPPEISLLPRGLTSDSGTNDEELIDKSRQIEVKLKDFGILGRVTEVHPGPVITLFEFEPAAGIKVGRISALSDDLAMTLRSVSVRIVAPIPGKGTVGIEVPNEKREIVRLRDVLESPESVRGQSILSVGLGKDTYGDAVVTDIATMPHLLIAGATGTGKSVCINAVLLSLLYRATPAELGLILIDPKILELSVYDGIPHLRVPVVTIPKQAKAVLDWAVHEMHRRYRLMQKVGVRGIDAYNRVARGEEEIDSAARIEEHEALDPTISLEEELVDGEDLESRDDVEEDNDDIVTAGETLAPIPKIVIVIDELADLMLTVGREIEDLITRLAQKARAAGIHLIVATQRPSVDVITGLIKANFPARLSFQVSSRVDSRTIIDSIGAEKLLGQGDMLFMPPGVGSLRRVHGAFVSDSEVKRVVAALKKNCKPVYDPLIQELCDKALKEDLDGAQNANGGADEYDALYDEAVKVVLEKGKASTSLVQRVLRIGYNRAARIIETMERDGLIGPADGAKPREVIGSSSNDFQNDL